jgi:hypothetical protein
MTDSDEEDEATGSRAPPPPYHVTDTIEGPI